MAGRFPDGRFHDDRDSSLSQAEYIQAGDAVDRRKACSAFDGSAGALADVGRRVLARRPRSLAIRFRTRHGAVHDLLGFQYFVHRRLLRMRDTGTSPLVVGPR